jgi:hypothetical protein
MIDLDLGFFTVFRKSWPDFCSPVYFNPEQSEEVDIATFCSFIPAASVMRKFTNFFRIDAAEHDAILPADVKPANDLERLEAIEPANSFLFNTAVGEKTVFNLVSVNIERQ